MLFNATTSDFKGPPAVLTWLDATHSKDVVLYFEMSKTVGKYVANTANVETAEYVDEAKD